MGPEDAGSRLRTVRRNLLERSVQGDCLGRRPRSRAPRKPRLRRLAPDAPLIRAPRAAALGLLAALIATCAAAGPAQAGAWPRKKGEGLLILTTLLDRADTAYDSGGGTVDDGYFYKDETAAYLEYGVTDRVTAITRLAWQSVRRRQGAILDTADGLAASELGVRYGAWQDTAQVVSLQLTALVPGAGENVSNRPLGEGGTAWEARGLWGRAFGRRHFTDVQLAHRWRSAPDLDEVRLDLTWGWRPAERWQVFAQAFSVWSAEDARPGRPRFRQHKLQLSLGRTIAGAEYHAGIYVTPSGRNTLDERAVFLSVWRRF